MHASVARLPEYLDVELTGHVDLQPFLDLIRQLGVLTKANGDKRLLFDLLRLQGEMHFAGQIQMGEQVAHYLPHLKHIASVVPTRKLTRTSEKVARKQGVQLRIFDSRLAAIAWLEGEHDDGGEEPMDPARAAIWAAVQHLFPRHAQAIQLPNGTLAVSWAMASKAKASNDMATPITIRLEPELLLRLQAADADQRQQIALHHEPAFRAGLIGYDPLTDVPKARVIVLG